MGACHFRSHQGSRLFLHSLIFYLDSCWKRAIRRFGNNCRNFQLHTLGHICIAYNEESLARHDTRTHPRARTHAHFLCTHAVRNLFACRTQLRESSSAKWLLFMSLSLKKSLTAMWKMLKAARLEPQHRKVC